MELTFVFFIAILIMSVVIHEVSHGLMAEQLGDKTARMEGRLTLNPINHLDMVGSFIVPVLMYFSTAATGHPMTFGWAKPVPYNPYNLRNQKWGPGAVAFAGPAANLIIAAVFGTMIRFSGVLGLAPSFLDILSVIVYLNIVLAVFNMIPIPPLDGSKVLAAFLPYKYTHIMDSLERYSFPLLIVLVFFGWGLVQPVIDHLYALLVG